MAASTTQKRHRGYEGQPRLFPVPADVGTADVRNAVPVVVSGSFRRDLPRLERDIAELLDAGCRVLSPTTTDFVEEREGFVYAAGQEGELPRDIELEHLAAIRRSAFMWLHAPGGYVGVSGALEIGAARTCGVPIFARVAPSDVTIASFVEIVPTPAIAVARTANDVVGDPGAPLRVLQEYYSRRAAARGWDDESPRDVMLLLTEELGELARAIRRMTGLKRDGAWTATAGEELADVQLYVVHLANALELDLGAAVTRKEAENERRVHGRVEATA